MRGIFDFYSIIEELKRRRKIFVSEADLQLEVAWVIKEKYPSAKVRLEFCPTFDSSIHLDILVMIDGVWYPIELKYKTRECRKIVDEEAFFLKNQGARDIGMYLYLKDIERIERIRDNVSNYGVGYAMIITNDSGYTKKPRNDGCHYVQFSLEDGAIKTGTLRWKGEAKIIDDKKLGKPIALKGEYRIEWKEYSIVDDQDTGAFIYNVNEILG